MNLKLQHVQVGRWPVKLRKQRVFCGSQPRSKCDGAKDVGMGDARRPIRAGPEASPFSTLSTGSEGYFVPSADSRSMTASILRKDGTKTGNRRSFRDPGPVEPADPSGSEMDGRAGMQVTGGWRRMSSGRRRRKRERGRPECRSGPVFPGRRCEAETRFRPKTEPEDRSHQRNEDRREDEIEHEVMAVRRDDLMGWMKTGAAALKSEAAGHWTDQREGAGSLLPVARAGRRDRYRPLPARARRSGPGDRDCEHPAPRGPGLAMPLERTRNMASLTGG